MFSFQIFCRNIVSTVNLGCKLDLKTIALRARNAEYNPKVRAALMCFQPGDRNHFRGPRMKKAVPWPSVPALSRSQWEVGVAQCTWACLESVHPLPLEGKVSQQEGVVAEASHEKQHTKGRSRGLVFTGMQ